MGAGLSGIGAACHLQKNCPNKSYAILEARPSMGGTCDVFRYPGIRSDSDMYTLGYNCKPWTNPKSIDDGPAILGYIKETAQEHNVESKIQFNTKIIALSWSTENAQWTIKCEYNKTKTSKVFT